MDQELIIAQTKKWILDVVIGCNFCPFAAKEYRLDTIHYHVSAASGHENALYELLMQCKRLDEQKDICTTLILFPDAYHDFGYYLDLVSLAEELIEAEGYSGVYQVASFHPDYIFEGTNDNSPENYTNRSVYPMLHILRENSITEAISKYKDPEQIPMRNIEYSRKKGLEFMKGLRNACMEPE